MLRTPTTNCRCHSRFKSRRFGWRNLAHNLALGDIELMHFIQSEASRQCGIFETIGSSSCARKPDVKRLRGQRRPELLTGRQT